MGLMLHPLRPKRLRWSLCVPVGEFLVSDAQRQQRGFVVGRADELQAQRQMVRAEAHRDAEGGKANQVSHAA